jgi:CO/xanthine dehydrogenase FAD-binding subunit
MAGSSAYLRPERLGDALDALARGPLTVLAGGTDVYPARVGRSFDGDVLDIAGLGELRGLRTQADGRLRIGALTRWADLAGDRGLPPHLTGLALAARDVGGRQIQNVATLGGNLCHASPAADAVPNLLALDAGVELASSARGRRELRLGEFVLGNRRTALAPDELLTAILVPAPRGEAASTFLKLGGRRYLVISAVAVAAALDVVDGRVARAGIAVGACAPTARRLPALEERLLGERLGPGLGRLVDPECLAPLSPIDDARGTAAYRLDTCLTLLRRGLVALVDNSPLAQAA